MKDYKIIDDKVVFDYDDLEPYTPPLCDDCGSELTTEPLIIIGTAGVETMFDDTKIICSKCYVMRCNN